MKTLTLLLCASALASCASRTQPAPSDAEVAAKARLYEAAAEIIAREINPPSK